LTTIIVADGRLGLTGLGMTPVRFEIRFRRRNIPDRELVADLRRVARTNRGKQLTAALYAREGQFGSGTFMRRFGSWNGALAAAKVPITHRWNVPDAELLENLAHVWRRLGRQPTGRDLGKADGISRFACSTYKQRFGSWHGALKAFAKREPYKGGKETKRAAHSIPQRRWPRTANWRLRAAVLIRDNCLCRMCGASPAKDPSVTLHVDHIDPWSKGGPTTLANLQTLCAVCNIGKADRAL
jgi:hypothetical protein